MTSTPELVIFDCDGVLVDSEVIAIEVGVAALAGVGVVLTPAALASRFVGVSGPAMRAAVAEEFDVDLDETFWVGVREASHAALAERVTAVPGIRGLVDAVQVPRCLASSSSHTRIELSLRTAGLLDLFPPDLRFSAEDVVRGKPAPDLFLHASAAMGADPSACVVVEDSPYGVRAALAAGMDVIGFTGGGHADDAWAERLRAAGAPRVVADADALAALLP